MAGNRFSFVTYSDDNNGCVVKSDDQKNKKADGSGVVDGKLIFTCPVEFRKEVTGITAGGGNILTGSIANGGTIPVPSGYARANCKYIVSTRTVSSKHGNHNSSHNHSCYVDANTGIVTVNGIGTGSGTANYMVIASK
mgnify:CR=1 FL=1